MVRDVDPGCTGLGFAGGCGNTRTTYGTQMLVERRWRSERDEVSSEECSGLYRSGSG